MSARRREVEMLLLTMFAAVPLYATQTISFLPLFLFHAVLGGIAFRVSIGRSPEIVPVSLVRAFAIAYVPFYLIDAALISRSAIAASTHLALFISVYQPIEERSRSRLGQRLLTTAMIFTASIATATHILILPFVVVFAFFMLRQLMSVAHTESVASIDAAAHDLPTTRAAGFYIAATCAVAIVLFPTLPRVRNPLVPGMAGALNNASTGLSDSIDFNRERSISADSSVVSRVWMSREAVPFFTPLRLRGSIYDRFHNNEWRQAPRRGFVPVVVKNGYARIGNASGFTRAATVQQKMILGSRLFLPAGTYAVNAPGVIYEGPPHDVYSIWQTVRNRDAVSYEVRLARTMLPLHPEVPRVTNYPVTPPVAAMARNIVGSEIEPMSQAGAIEHYLMTRFRYVPDPASIGRAITVDEFLLHEHRGHCEYFAAGMVALMTSLNVPARIVGGFYGGQLNPLTGYFVVRREDAHAWVEVWNGKTWETFDPTPASLRPGNAHSGLLKMYATAISDSVNYFWDRYILTFGLGDQIALFADFISRIRGTMALLRSTNARIATALASRELMIAIGGVLAIVALIIAVGRRRRSLFDLLADRLQRLGIEVGDAMTMEEALAELRRTRPDAAMAFAPLIAMYEEEQFSARSDRKRRAILRRALATSADF